MTRDWRRMRGVSEIVGDDQERLESTFYLHGEAGELVDFIPLGNLVPGARFDSGWDFFTVRGFGCDFLRFIFFSTEGRKGEVGFPGL